VKAAATAGLVLALALAAPPLVGFDSYVLYVLGTAWLWGALASAWALLAFAGPVSFGHAVYFGAGAYATALLTLHGGLSPWLGVAAAAGVGAAVALPIGLGAGRLAGAELAVATFAYAEGGRALAQNWTGLTGGGAGLIGIPALTEGREGGYYLALALLVVALALVAGLRCSPVGLAWAALRECPARAWLLGVPPLPYTLLAFACSGALTGAGGALYAHAVRVVEPDLVFGRSLSLLPLVMAVFGGARALLGPAAGALLLSLVTEVVLQPALPRFHQVPYALALVAVVLWLPRGLAGLVRRA
jgi:branched-chain amino acid transport system permease protein